MHLRQLAAVLIGLVFFALPAIAAGEAEPQALAAILDAMERKYGHRPAYAGLETGAERIVLRDVRFTPPRGEEGAEVRAAMVELSLPASEGGLYRIAALTLRDFVVEDGGVKEGKGLRIRIPLLELKDVSLLPRAAARSPREELVADSLLAGAMNAPDIYFEPRDGQALVLKGMHSSWSGDRRTGMGKGRLDFGRLTLPVDLLSGEGGDDTLKALGYENLVLGAVMDFSGDWGEDGRVHVDFSFRFGADNAGYQQIEMIDLGVPEALMRRLSEMEKHDALAEELATAPEAALKVLSGVTIRGMRLRYEDRSLAARLIDHMAKKEGIPREAWIANTAAFPQIFLMQIGLPRLAAQASDELRRFLADPKSLEVSFQAKAPMSLDSLMTLMADPAGLVDTLNLKIVANGGK